VIERSVNDQPETGAIGGEGRQAVPVDVEAAIVKRGYRLVKDVTFVDIVDIGQPGESAKIE